MIHFHSRTQVTRVFDLVVGMKSRGCDSEALAHF